ncbi:MAG: hypothetical protein ACRD3A_07650 [Terriglobales bacterium]
MGVGATVYGEYKGKEIARREEEVLQAIRARREGEFGALTPAQHLRAANEIVERRLLPSPGSLAASLDELNLASRHLRAIPASVPESQEAAEVLHFVS